VNYEILLVNPRTNEERKLTVELSPEQAKVAKEVEWSAAYVQALARPDIPPGYMPIGNGVRAATLQ